MREIIAPAKLNLTLHITGKRADGYHELESIVAFIDLADRLCAELSKTLSLMVEGEFAEASGDAEDNLVMKAARALQDATGCKKGANMTLTKNIPAGAGLGGGSSDAAAVLLLLSELWQVESDLPAIAATLGADVPMFLHVPTPLMVQGVGDSVEPLPAFPHWHAVLVYPNTPLATAAVYQSHRFEKSGKSLVHNMAQWVQMGRNDLQRTAITLLPEVAEALLALETALPSPLLARMTGSGSCCFALYEKEDAAMSAAAALAEQYPHWWVKQAALLS